MGPHSEELPDRRRSGPTKSASADRSVTAPSYGRTDTTVKKLAMLPIVPGPYQGALVQEVAPSVEWPVPPQRIMNCLLPLVTAPTAQPRLAAPVAGGPVPVALQRYVS